MLGGLASDRCCVCAAFCDPGDMHRVAHIEGARAICARCLGEMHRARAVYRCEICGTWMVAALAVIRERPHARVVSCDDPACEDTARDWMGNAEIFGRRPWLNIRP